MKRSIILCIVTILFSESCFASEQEPADSEMVKLQQSSNLLYVANFHKDRPSFAERFIFVDNLISSIQCTDSVNLPLTAHALQGFTESQCYQFSKKILNFPTQNPLNSTIYQHDIYRILTEVITESVYDIKASNSYYKNNINLLVAGYHEAGHAHIDIHSSRFYILQMVDLAIRKKQSKILWYRSRPHFAGGATYRHQSFDVDYNGLNLSDYKESKIAYIVMLFGGGVAEQIFSEKIYKSSWLLTCCRTHNFHDHEKGFANFLSRASVRSDLEKIEQTADWYIKTFENPLIFVNGAIDEKLLRVERNNLMKACYVRAYDFIATHQQEIEKTVAVLIRDRYIDGDKVYEHAGIIRPKYFYEQNGFRTIKNNKGKQSTLS